MNVIKLGVEAFAADKEKHLINVVYRMMEVIEIVCVNIVNNYYN